MRNRNVIFRPACFWYLFVCKTLPEIIVIKKRDMRKSHVPQSSLFQECLARLELIPQSDIEAIIRLDIGSKRSFDLNESECILVEVIRAPCRDFSPGIFHADAAPVFNPVAIRPITLSVPLTLTFRLLSVRYFTPLI